jgi:hypothetical protein
MLKKLLLTALAVGLASTFSLQTTPAEAVGMRGMTCKDAAKAKYPGDRASRIYTAPGVNNHPLLRQRLMRLEGPV